MKINSNNFFKNKLTLKNDKCVMKMIKIIDKYRSIERSEKKRT